MIFTKREFRTVTQTHMGQTLRVCTGEVINKPTEDDIGLGEAALKDVLFITKRSDVAKCAKTSIITQCVLILLSIVAFGYSFYRVFRLCLLASKFVWSVWSIPTALFAAYFVLCLRSLCNLTVHDRAGHWVNLRTGSSNLCGGIVIRRKPRWA